MSSALEARDLVKEYPGVLAVDGVSFTVPEGICFGLLAATILTLLYVPALYLIVQDVINIFSRSARVTEALEFGSGNAEVGVVKGHRTEERRQMTDGGKQRAESGKDGKAAPKPIVKIKN